MQVTNSHSSTNRVSRYEVGIKGEGGLLGMNRPDILEPTPLSATSTVSPSTSATVPAALRLTAMATALLYSEWSPSASLWFRFWLRSLCFPE